MIYKPLKVPKVFLDHLNDDLLRYIVFSGGRGGGKSQACARFIIHKSLTCKGDVLCLRAYQNSIGDSVYSLIKSLIFSHNLHDLFVFFRTEVLSKKTGARIKFKGLQNFSSIRSISESIKWCWLEEAQQIVDRETIFDLLPSFRSIKKFIFTLNPYHDPDIVTEAVQSLSKSDPAIAKIVRVNYDANPWFAENSILTQLMEADRKNDTKKYNHVWLGSPYLGDELGNVAINLDGLKSCFSLEGDDHLSDIHIGVDVARYGVDRSCICVRSSWKILELHSYDQTSATRLADLIRITIERYPLNPTVIIDESGLGGPILDLVKRECRLEATIKGVNFGGKSPMKGYANKAGFMFMGFNRLLPKLSLIAIRSKQSLILKQASRTYSVNEFGKVVIEKKDSFRARVGIGSPDELDSLLLCCSELILEEALKTRPSIGLTVINGQGQGHNY